MMLLADLHQAFWTIAVGSVCGVSCALLGCYLVLKRMSLLCDGIGHGMLPGIALAVLLTGRLAPGAILAGAMVFGMLTALLAQALNKLGKVTEDAALGVVFTSLFAVGVIIISMAKSLRLTHIDADCVFFGMFELIPLDTFAWLEIPRAFPTMVLSLALTVVFITLLGKELQIAAFDPGLATAMGFNAQLLHYMLVALVAASTVTAFSAVGAIVVLAMFIVPAATAQLLTDRLRTMRMCAAVVALVSAFAGYLFAVILNCNVGGMMACVAGLQLLLAVLFAPRHGMVAKALRNYQLALRMAGEEILAALYRAKEAGIAVPSLELPDHGFAPLTVRLAFRQLVRKELLLQTDGTWQLTEQGRHEAASVVRAHRLWEAFLGQNFQLPLDHLHAPASRMEHFIGPEMQSELAKQLEQPARDPHGKTIPPP